MTNIRWIGHYMAFALLLVPVAHGQDSTAADTTVEDALHRMSDQAGVVFVGEVVAIRHIAGEGGASGVVEVEFRVDQAVRGGVTGGSYVLREWAGLWSGSDQRYRVGQRLLMLLHSPGAGGVTSPVGGMAGAIPIRGSATSLTATATASSMPSPVADLCWVGTRLQRAVAYRDASEPLVSATDVPKAIGVDTAGSETSTAAQQASVSVVVNMLASWRKKDAK
ncbi:MAG TPA: hypothetical protein VNY78_01435 [Edaphobacter sp.]|nr:hypothetical protein [Edaphobacter sp.]